MMMQLATALRRLWPRRETLPALSSPTPQAAEPPVHPSRYWRAMVEAADDGLLACDEAGCLTIVNPAAAALLGVQPLSDAEPAEWPASVASVRAALERALADGEAAIEMEVDSRGRPLLLEGRANRMVDSNGRIEGAVLVLRDITRLRQLAAERSGSWE